MLIKEIFPVEKSGACEMVRNIFAQLVILHEWLEPIQKEFCIISR